MKLMYHEHTPEAYEPPFFVAAEGNKAERKSNLGPIERNAYTDDEPRAGA